MPIQIHPTTTQKAPTLEIKLTQILQEGTLGEKMEWMARTWTVGRQSLMGHGVFMLGFGIALTCLASLMTNPELSRFGYSAAVVMTAVCLLFASLIVYLGGLANSAHQTPQMRIYLLGGGGTLAGWLIVWLLRSAPGDIPLLAVMAVFYGLFWGLWLIRLAFHFHAYRGKAATLSVLAALTSTLGIILATQPGMSEITAVTAVACYMTYIGILILLTTLLVYRDCRA